MQKTCVVSGTPFEITNDDLKFYDRISPIFNGKKYAIPAPTLCSEERQRRRMTWRNERTLYARTCSLSGKRIIAAYPAESAFPVYTSDIWWGDQFDPLAYGREFDFSRPFFDQFQELLQTVPRLNLANSNNENCEYVNYTNYSKNCYLIFGNHSSENCCYDWRVHECLNCFDSGQLNSCQHCYECLDCDNCQNLRFSQNCQNCFDSSYLMNCLGCRNCFMCCNLVHQEYHILNQKYSPQEYGVRVEEIQRKGLEALRAEFQQFVLKFPQRAVHVLNCQDCSGDYLLDSKNCHDVFSVKKAQDCRYIFLGEEITDCVDCDVVGWPAELCYEGTSTGVNAVRNLFSSLCWSCTETLYCDFCFNSQNIFGCTGLKKNSYCILNKQYSKDKYEKLVPRIIEHMMSTPLKSPLEGGKSEWGEFFPIQISPFSYNETVAQEHYPLSKEEILKRGWRWREIEEPDFSGVTKKIPAAKLPDSIDQVPDDILNWAIECSESKRLFMIQKAELEFYRQMNLPTPKFHPDIRHRERMKLRNPRKLWKRNCMNCKNPIETTYAPDRPEIVYCEKCYLETVY